MLWFSIFQFNNGFRLYLPGWSVRACWVFSRISSGFPSLCMPESPGSSGFLFDYGCVRLWILRGVSRSRSDGSIARLAGPCFGFCLLR